MSKVKWGILSTAQIGQKALIPAIENAENAEVVAIAGRNENVYDVAKAFQIPTAYMNYEELLKDENVDAVYIPLPNSLHKDWVVKAAEHGKHVLVEKPAGLNADEVQVMVDACEKHNVKFMEAFMYQFHPQHDLVKKFIAEGEIGDVSFIRSSFSFYLPGEDENIRLNPELGGGTLYDVGCYALHSIRNITGSEPVEVFVRGKKRAGSEVDTTVTGVMQLENGIEAVFDSSFDVTFRTVYEVVGTKGTIEVPHAFRPDKNGHNGVVIVHKEDGSTQEHQVFGDQYKLQVEHFSESVRTGQTPSYTPEKIWRHAKAMDACFESMKQNQPINL
ncbi:Gfo/Idh/MocA family protein [Salirhabdus salicampi]|uniref:Gfo/Idh/MocA family protein n=1 Tax=Salirhabdus salicampi TaxID=476102 RepID=UPI0020C3D227|nr:Gfo/Idh/MocA family oxidoreductase [Salirhabdus salicampi]MCP8617565.1 Gfo/Idh/MocA family oxidoreductase [Salirhabdus salicampi]